MTPPHDEAAHGRSLLSPVVAGTPVERLTGDRAFVEAMVATESALAEALADAGVVDRAVADVVVEVCTKLETNAEYVDDLALRATAGGNPAIPLVADLRDRVAAVSPAAAAAVHLGATSQDVVDTALMLLSRRTLEHLATDQRVAAEEAARLADAHRGTLACGRTLGQQALPTTFGMRAAGWLAGLLDAIARVQATAAALPVQLGGPVGATEAYGDRGPVVADALAARLGLVAPTLPWHTRRTPVVDVGHALVVACGAAGKVAADVVAMSQSEVGEVAEGSGGPSSSMPHKANPAQSVLVLSAARQVPALVSVLGASMVAEQERPAGAWHAEWEPLRQALRLTGGAVHRTAGLLAGLCVDAAAMRRNLDRLVATAGLADDVVAATPRAATPWIERTLALFDQTLFEQTDSEHTRGSRS